MLSREIISSDMQSGEIISSLSSSDSYNPSNVKPQDDTGKSCLFNVLSAGFVSISLLLFNILLVFSCELML